jgi:transcriptional regulator with XRE-family HTH domain
MELYSQDKNALLELLEGRLEALGIIGRGRNKTLAEMAGMAESTVSRILNGSKQVGMENIFKILHALDLISTTIDDPLTDKPTRQAMLTVKEIMESKDPCVVPALQANLAAFQMSVRANKENAVMKEKAREAETQNAELKKDIDRLTQEVKYLKEINHPPVPDIVSGGAGTST